MELEQAVERYLDLIEHAADYPYEARLELKRERLDELKQALARRLGVPHAA